MTIRYTAWYDPAFVFRNAEYEHAAISPKLIEYIREIREDIRINGLKNPLFVTIKNTRITIHPGKCRAKALDALGWETAPAIICNYDWPGFQWENIPAGSTAIGSPEQAQKYLGEDQVAQMSHRFFTVKKRWRENLDKPYV